MPRRCAAITPPVDVKLIDGVNHMGIVSAPQGRYPSIADDVGRARHGGSSGSRAT